MRRAARCLAGRWQAVSKAPVSAGRGAAAHRVLSFCIGVYSALVIAASDGRMSAWTAADALLVVDDDPSVRAMLRRVPRAATATTSRAADSGAAMRDRDRARPARPRPARHPPARRGRPDAGALPARALRRRHHHGHRVGRRRRPRRRPRDRRRRLRRQALRSARAAGARQERAAPDAGATPPRRRRTAAAAGRQPQQPPQLQAPRRSLGRCELDLEARRLFEAGGDEVAITAMEYDLLRVFLANPNRVLSRDQLLMQHAQPRVGAVRPLDRHPHRPAAHARSSPIPPASRAASAPCATPATCSFPREAGAR